jgi:predicted esterase
MQVVKQYLPATAIDNWPQAAVAATDFALQYGLKDDLAPPNLSVDLEGQLKQQGLDLKVCPRRQCVQLSASC